MSTAPATSVAQHEGSLARLRNFSIGALFALVLLIPKLLRFRRNAQSRMAFRILLGIAGAALVVLPLSLSNSWLPAVAGLAMFLAAILLPPARQRNDTDGEARELGALVVVNGGKFRLANASPAPVQLFVGPEKISAIDSRSRPLLVIPAAEITSAAARLENGCWILLVHWPAGHAEFFYHGIFAEHLARVAADTLAGVMQSPLPVLPRSRAASA
ncbi:MAG: hypothetical protein ACRD51_11615 [Candidatus Acidiferrum sp.]